MSSDFYIEKKGRIKHLNLRKKNWVEKNCALFTDCINEVNIAQMDNAKDIDVGMLMYNSTEYSDNYSKTSGSLWQYYRDEPFLDPNGNIVDFLLIIITVLRLNFTQI